jgi:hypothetical protein
MVLHRVTLVALATFLTAGLSSAAFAGCCGWGTPAPVVYATSGCGGCGASVAYVQPAPVATWGTGCGCGQSVVYAAAPVVEPQIAAAPIYVVDQGPEYSGPGIMIPYRTWSPAVAAAVDYPYVSGGYGSEGYGYGGAYHHGPRYAYGQRFYGHPHHMSHGWRYPHRHPLDVRG